MLKVRNSALVNDDFVVYFNDLMKRDMPAKVCLELSECIDELKSKFDILKRAQIAITKKYCVLDAKGEIAISGNTVTFVDMDKKQKCNDELNEILGQTVEIPLSTKIKIKDTETFSPYKYHLLKDVVEIVPAEEKK